MKNLFVVCFMLAATGIFPTITFRRKPRHRSCDPGPGSLPSNDPKYPANQLILVCKPANWNGDLIVYAHGDVPVQAPLALPLDDLTLSDGTFVPARYFWRKGGAASRESRSAKNKNRISA